MCYAEKKHAYGRRRRHGVNRRGATAVEMAILFPSFIFLTLFMFDMGLALLRYHVVAEAARHCARQAIVRGSMADALGPLGPESLSVTDFANNPMTEDIQTALNAIGGPEVDLQAEWVTGGNSFAKDDLVRVSVSVPYRPVVTFLFGNPELTLSATSTMEIAH